MKLIVKQSLLTLVSCILVTACTATNDDETRELPVSAPEAVGMSSDRLSKVDEVVERYIDEGRVHGVVIAVTRRGQVVYHKAHGAIDDTTGRTMQLDSLFDMASSTKQILGVAAMMAIEDGLFSPDDPVEKYIPEFDPFYNFLIFPHWEKLIESTWSSSCSGSTHFSRWSARNQVN